MIRLYRHTCSQFPDNTRAHITRLVNNAYKIVRVSSFDWAFCTVSTTLRTVGVSFLESMFQCVTIFKSEYVTTSEPCFIFFPSSINTYEFFTSSCLVINFIISVSLPGLNEEGKSPKGWYAATVCSLGQAKLIFDEVGSIMSFPRMTVCSHFITPINLKTRPPNNLSGPKEFRTIFVKLH